MGFGVGDRSNKSTFKSNSVAIRNCQRCVAIRIALIKFNSVVRVAAAKESYKVSGDPPKGSIIQSFQICRRYHDSIDYPYEIERWLMSRGPSRRAGDLELVDRHDYSVETWKEMEKEIFFVLKRLPTAI